MSCDDKVMRIILYHYVSCVLILSHKIQKSKKVKMTTVTSIFEAACGPEDFSGSKGTRVGWLLAQLNEEMVEAAGQDEEQDS